ncbi:uncharacterized protein LOC106012324, partial [Aplysia californica]|uniref:Uncharacterized protein LOC106012324 n=1 Tax=Aplysia californica TaxID=6500 RepID=A0ABM1A418_APLCA
MENQPCPLKDCPFSKEDHLVTATFVVFTAAHVVYDADEAVVTSVEFFYDDDKDRSEVVTAQAVQLGYADEGADTTCLKCICHDLALFHKMKSRRMYGKDVKWSMSVPIAVLISHPHGCSKQISVGDLVDRKELDPVQGLSFLKPSFKDGEEFKAMKNASADAKKCLTVFLDTVFKKRYGENIKGGDEKTKVKNTVFRLILKELRTEGCTVPVSESERDFWEKVFVHTSMGMGSWSLGCDRSWVSGVMAAFHFLTMLNFINAFEKAISFESMEKDGLVGYEFLRELSGVRVVPSFCVDVGERKMYRHVS